MQLFKKNLNAAGGQADFVIEMPEDRPVRILQVTDTQIIDSSQCRYEGRLTENSEKLWSPENVYDRMTYYLENAVKESKPDIIVHTGDFVYGEFDDSGRMLDKHIEIMESFGLPWALALGNHERETAIGAEEMCRRLENAPHCMFKGVKYINGNKLEGVGNCSVLLQKDGKPQGVLYMIDSGCGTEEYPGGVYENQKAWMREVYKTYGVTGFAYFHIAPLAVNRAAAGYGYDPQNFVPFEIKADNGDFGYWGLPIRDEHCIDWDGSLMNLFEEIRVKGAFIGHFHEHSVSMLIGGVRVTFGLKTGEYDSHLPDKLGGTLMKFPENNGEGFSVRHIVIQKR